MVFRPSRGDAPTRIGPGVTPVHPVVTTEISADVYRDARRYELEVEHVLRASWLIAGRSSEMPGEGDWITYEGHGDTVVVSRLAGDRVAAFHNVCQHRGTRLTRGATSGCDRRFTCPWHGWVYDQTGALVGVPERQDFAPESLEGLRSPKVAAEEWGGWVWINLAGPDVAPPLRDWIGKDITADLGRFAMEDMVLHEKIVVDLDVNYKMVVDGFNEVYHAFQLHHTGPAFARAARATAFHISGPNAMMFVPRADHLDKLAATGDHQRYTICHYVVFPTSVFNNNPDQIQLFQAVPLGPERTRFITWELIYGPQAGEDPAAYARYHAATMRRWDELKEVVSEDVFVFNELSATRHSMGYRSNRFGRGEVKIAEYHRTMDHCIQGGSAMDRYQEQSSDQKSGRHGNAQS